MPRVLHLVPRLPPRVDGVGQFALRLGEELAGRWGFENQFLACSAGANRQRLQSEIVGIAPDLILLHYSGYGYSRQGVPFWLVRALEESPAPLAIFFHEIWSSSFPWRKPFWLEPLQRRIVRRLQHRARAAFTSTLKMRGLLSPGTQLVAIPSPLPPTAVARRPSKAPFELAVFGQAPTRLRSLHAHAQLLRELRARGNLSTLHLAGMDANPGSADALLAGKLAGPDRIKAWGEQPPEALGQILAGADAFLSFYPSGLLTKSSTAVAALACGCPVVLPGRSRVESWNPPPPFLACGGSKAAADQFLAAADSGRLDRLSHEGREWSDQNASWERAGRVMGKTLANIVPTAPEAMSAAVCHA